MSQFDKITNEIIDNLLKLNLAKKEEFLDENNNKNYYYLITPNALDKEFVCVIVSGHPEKAGVWSHTLLSQGLIDESSMKPYFEAFNKKGWGLVALNPHLFEDDLEGARYFYQLYKLLNKINLEAKLGFVTFSMGGRIIIEFIKTYAYFLKRIEGIVLIDPVLKNYDDKDLIHEFKEKFFIMASDDQNSYGRFASIFFEIPAIYFKGIHGEMPNKSLNDIIKIFETRLKNPISI